MRKFTKIVAAGACAAVLAFGCLALAGCGSSSSSSSESSSESASTEATATDAAAPADNTLVVGFDSAYPPYGYLVTDDDEEGFEASDGNKYTGFDLELANEVCQRNGWTLKVEPIDWDAKDTLLNAGTINCIWNGFTLEGREDKYTFSGSYMVNEQVVVVKSGSDISSLEDLAGKNVITQADSAAYDLLVEEGDQAELGASFAGGAVQTIKDYDQAFMQLESGAVDAVACDLSIAAYHLTAKPDAFTQLDDALNAEHYAVGFKQGDDALAQTVTDTLKAMDSEGFVKELCEKYADQGMDYANWCLE